MPLVGPADPLTRCRLAHPPLHTGGRTANHPNLRVRQDLQFMQANYVDSATQKPMTYSQM